jgi:hypothetical protein
MHSLTDCSTPWGLNYISHSNYLHIIITTTISTPNFPSIIVYISLVIIVNSNLVQYLLQTDIQKRTEKIQWQIQTLHRDFSPENPNRENQHIIYSFIVL